ncbi:hypothetical protein Tco_0287544 [Tanacetum coccineum]
MTSKAQQSKLDNALVSPENRRVIGKCSMRINPGMKPKEPTYQVVLDALALTSCYPAFLVTAEVPVIYMHQFWATITKHKSSYQFKINNKKFSVNAKVFRDILNIYHLHQPWRTFASIINKCLCGKVSGFDKIRLSRVQILYGMYYKKNLDFVALIWEDLAYQIDNMDSKKQDKMFYPIFTKIIIHHFLDKDKSILMRNRTFMHTTRDNSLLGTMRFVSRHADTQVYGAILPKAMTNQALLYFVPYKTYYAIASDSAISSEESPSKKKSTKAKKVTTTKPKPTKKKAPVSTNRGKGLNVLSEVALYEVARLKEATKQRKKDFHISQVSSSGDGTDFESGVPDEQHHKTSGTDEGTATKPGVLDVPKYDSESDKESWGDSGEEDDDDEDDDEDDEGNDANDDSDGNDDDDGNDGNDGNDEDDDMNDDDEEIDSDRTESGIIKIHVLNQSSTEYYEEEEEKIDDEEKMDEEEDDEVTKELYKDVNINLGNIDADMTDTDQGSEDQQNVSQESGFEQVEEDAHVTLTPVLDTQKTDELVQSSSISSDFTSKLLNLENSSLADNEIASLMDTTVLHEEPRSQTSSLYTIPVTATPEVTSVFTTTIPPPPPFFNPLPQQATPTPTPTTSEATTLYPSLPDFSYVFKFNDRVTNLEKDLSEIKQVDQYAQALSSIPAIVDRYIDNKLGEAIQKAIVAHNLDCREEAQAEKRDYIELIDTSMRAIIREEILIDKIEKNKSYDKADYKRELYDALVKSYQTDKDLFDTYGEVFMLKRSRDDRDKDRDPSAGSDRGTKRRKSSKEAESSRDSRSKEKKSLSTSKGASHSQHKPSGKSAHAEEPSHTVDDSRVQQDQEFDMGNNDEQPADKEVSKDDCQVAREKEPRTSFDELMDASFDFSAFVLNRLNIKDLTQEILVGPAFELLKGTCKSLTELKYHLEECSKATTERLDWHNPEGKPYPFDLNLVRNLWSPVKVIYDKHAYWGTSHWGPKRQHFYGFAANMSSSKDVYSRKRIIAVTILIIIKKYDYGHLEEIEVRRDDQKLYKFREGDFP